MEYTCHSGGCPGADMTWENEGLKHGVKTIAYSFPGHHHDSATPQILTPDELEEGLKHVILAGPSLAKPLSETWPPKYIQNLLSRNWFQVKNADRIYAIGRFMNREHILAQGGTGWAVQMAKDNNKSVYIFDQDSNKWFMWHPGDKKFMPLLWGIPTLTPQFAGIGTRAITEHGIHAIKQLFEHNFA